MAKDKKFDPAVYVNINSLEAWGSKMETINNSAIDTLKDLKGVIDGISDSWEGDSSDAFYNNIESFLVSAIETHNLMKNIENFLYEVIETMENQ